MVDFIRSERLRNAATMLVMAVLAVAGLMIVLDGRPALAADDCQYGQYGPYAPYAPYGPYGQACPKAKPTLRLIVPFTAGLGTSVIPSAVLENGDNPTGQLNFWIHRPGEPCRSASFPPAWFGTTNVAGNGSYTPGLQQPFPSPVVFDTLGPWRWSATYVGDSRNELTATVCDTFNTEVTKRTPGLELTLWTSPPFEVGAVITIRGTLHAYQPTQAVTFRLYAPTDPTCSGEPAVVKQVNPPNFEASFGPLESVGTWRLRTFYPGDAYNEPLATTCEAAFPFNVSKFSSTLSPLVSQASAIVGEPFSAGAQVNANAPTGTLTIRLFAPADESCGTPVATKTVAVEGAGPYTAPLAASSIGVWRVISEYSGDASNTPATTPCGSVMVNVAKATPTLTVTALPRLAEDGDRIHARVDIVGYNPTGNVTLALFEPSDASCTGEPAYFEIVPLTGTSAATVMGVEVPKHQVGTWNWVAAYTGDDNNESDASRCGLTPVEVVKKVKKDR